ncbi:MAG: WD40 repeat domain-containing protein, partial [Planctomycetes bacterium]|nr:WD40 repeat domain-containing protein [Planctomycetota bacterium]
KANAIANAVEARRNERKANRQEQIAKAKAEDAAAAAFRSKIGLVASQIEANIFNRAKSELTEIAEVSGDADWFQPPPWEFRRLEYMLNLSDQTVDTQFAVNTVAVSPDGQTIAAGGEANRVLLYAAAQQAPQVIEIGLQQVTDIAFSASGRRLLIACVGDSTDNQGVLRYTSEILVWDRDADTPVRLGEPLDGYWILDLDVRGTDDNLQVVAGLADKASLPGEVTSDVLRLWQNSAETVLVGHEASVSAVALSPDGETLISADVSGVAQVWCRQADGAFSLLREQDKDVFMPNGGEAIHDVRFSPDGSLVATAGGDGSIKFWRHAGLIQAAYNADLRAAARSQAGHTGGDYDTDYSAYGELLVSGGEDGTVRVWKVDVSPDEPVRDDAESEVKEIRQVALLRGHSAAVHSCSFSPIDSDRIVSGSADHDIRYWSLSGYREFLAIRSEKMPDMLYGCFSPDGQQVITAHRRGLFFGAAAVWPLDFSGDKPSLDPAAPRKCQEGHTLFVTRAEVYHRADRTELMTLGLDGL